MIVYGDFFLGMNNMTWIKSYRTINKYEFTSVNQYGCRYKISGVKRLSVARLQCKIDNVNDIQVLVLLSHTLDVPIRYDWDDHKAYIEVISHEALKGYL